MQYGLGEADRKSFWQHGCSVSISLSRWVFGLFVLIIAAVSLVPASDAMAYEAIAKTAVNARSISITKIRFGKLTGGGTRVVIESSAKLDPQLLLLKSPYRVVLDIPGGTWAMKGNSKSLGVVNAYRHNYFDPKTYRIVLDLKQPAKVLKSFTLSPRSGYGHRYVIDLSPTSANVFSDAAKQSIKVNREKSVKTYKDVKGYTAKKSKGKKVIVLDAGHGGKDVGTVGRYGGAHESILTLAIARELKKKLDSTGKYKIYLTRNSDILLDHRFRFELARRFEADLFISIHVDAVDNTKTRGGSVYTLSEKSSDAEAARLARKENKAHIIAGMDLNNEDKQVSSILIELAQRQTLNYSSQFAELLVKEMRKEVRMLKTAHRYAPLMVLKAPDLPSVLVESGYQTNKSDAKLLNSKAGRAKLIRGIVRGIDNYFATVKSQF